MNCVHSKQQRRCSATSAAASVLATPARAASMANESSANASKSKYFKDNYKIRRNNRKLQHSKKQAERQQQPCSRTSSECCCNASAVLPTAIASTAASGVEVSNEKCNVCCGNIDKNSADSSNTNDNNNNYRAAQCSCQTHSNNKAYNRKGRRKRKAHTRRQAATRAKAPTTTANGACALKWRHAASTSNSASATNNTSHADSATATALTSFLLSSTLLSLYNATAAAAIAMVTNMANSATLSESLSGDSDAAWPQLLPNGSMLNGSYGLNEFDGAATSATGAASSDVLQKLGAADVSSSNNSDISLVEAEEDGEYIFDRTDVRIIFITLYTLVFCCCFFGNLLVILVVTLSRRLRSITNFFLANLAVADFCVGLFCVMQNLSIYLIDSWVFGEFLCRMYQFVHSLSYTASIFILVVICTERYFAIVHPITCKQILTAARLRMVILTVWVTSAVYSTPKFVFSKTIKNIHTEDGQEEEICVLDRKMFNSKLLDMINFGLLYVIPLLVMTVLYTKIAIALWRSSHGLSHHLVAQHQHQQHQQQQQHQEQQENSMTLHNSMYHHHHHHSHQHGHHNNQGQHASQQASQNHQLQHNINLTQNQNHHSHNHLQQQQVVAGTCVVAGGTNAGLLTRKQSSKYEKRGVSITESQVSLDSERPIVSACRSSTNSNTHNGSGHSAHSGSGKSSYNHPHPHQRARVNHMSHSSNNVLRARRGVVRMLIIFVLTFALCNLPYHARKMWQYWSRSYRGDSNFNALLTPLTFLVTYFNSGINPLLYAFLSRNFRKGMKELLLCSWKKGKGKSSSNSSMHHKRIALQQTHSLPTDTTHIGNELL